MKGGVVPRASRKEGGPRQGRMPRAAAKGGCLETLSVSWDLSVPAKGGYQGRLPRAAAKGGCLETLSVP